MAEETKITIIPKGLHAAEHETGGIDEVSVAGLLGISAELAIHAALANAHHSIATGNYVGDGGDDRQIAVGFICSMVVVLCPLGARSALFIPNMVIELGDGTEEAGGSEIHATDGFTVFQTADELNTGATTYYYWAISE